MSRHDERPRHRLRNFFIFLLIVGGLFVAGLWGSSFYLSPQSKLEQADAIVVVSGGQTQTRAERGIELYKEGYAPKLIFSGAALDDGPSNARQMKQLALSSGVPERDIITDEKAQTTYENAVNTKQELGSARRIILVTSPYHQRRAYLTFKKVYGDDYRFLNESSFDNRWSKATWWATPFGVSITASELVKVGYIYITGNYQ